MGDESNGAPGVPAAAREAMEAAGRVDLAAAYRLCEYYKFNEGVCNHLSYMVDEDTFLVNDYGMSWDEVTAENLLLVDERGKVLKGEGSPDSTAFWIHSRIHKARPKDARCILHTHMPWSTALCCIEEGRLEMCHQNCLRFYEDIAYDPEFNGLVLDEAEGDRLCRAMGDKKVFFHANHGVIVVGASVHEAFDDLYYLERAAEVVVKAMSTGRPLKIIDTDTCEEFRRQMAVEGNERWARMHFNALKRKLKRGIGNGVAY